MTMGTRAVAIAAVAACAAFGVQTVRGAAGDAAGVAQGAGDRRSVWDGVYTDAQAKRGKETYDYSCATCHAPDLEGDSSRDVPPLRGDEFLEGWNGRPIGGLFDVISKSMPKDAPASLRPQTYADVVAYLLQGNEFPAGERELPADVTALERIAITKVPSKGQK